MSEDNHRHGIKDRIAQRREERHHRKDDDNGANHDNSQDYNDGEQERVNTERALKSNNYNDVAVGPKSLNKSEPAAPKPLYEIRGIYADKEKWL